MNECYRPKLLCEYTSFILIAGERAHAARRVARRGGAYPAAGGRQCARDRVRGSRPTAAVDRSRFVAHLDAHERTPLRAGRLRPPRLHHDRHHHHEQRRLGLVATGVRRHSVVLERRQHTHHSRHAQAGPRRICALVLSSEPNRTESYLVLVLLEKQRVSLYHFRFRQSIFVLVISLFQF